MQLGYGRIVRQPKKFDLFLRSAPFVGSMLLELIKPSKIITTDGAMNPFQVWVGKMGATKTNLWIDPINEIEIAQRFIPRLNHHQDNLSSHLHRPQHPASYLVGNDNLPNAQPSS